MPIVPKVILIHLNGPSVSPMSSRYRNDPFAIVSGEKKVERPKLIMISVPIHSISRFLHFSPAGVLVTAVLRINTTNSSDKSVERAVTILREDATVRRPDRVSLQERAEEVAVVASPPRRFG